MKRIIVNVYCVFSHQFAVSQMLNRILNGYHLPNFPYDLKHIQVRCQGIAALGKFDPGQPVGGTALKVIVQSPDMSVEDRKALAAYNSRIANTPVVKSLLTQKLMDTEEPEVHTVIQQYNLLEYDLATKIVNLFTGEV